MISVSIRLIRMTRRVFVPVLLAILVSSSASSSVGYAQTASSQPPAPDTPTASTTTAPDAQNEQRLLSRTRQLIFEGRRSGEGYWNSTGDKIVFQSEREDDNPFYQIYSLDFNTGDIDLVSPGYGKTTCAYYNWADESQILFGSTHTDPEARAKMQEEIEFRESGQTRKYAWDYDPTMHLFVQNTETGQTKQLTDAKGYDAEGSFSPNGEYIAFASTRSAYEGDLTPEEAEILERDPSYFGEIYLMKADGSELKRLTNTPGYDGGPFFSPDGQRIIWRRFDEKGLTAEVFTMNLDGTDQRQITHLGAMSWAPFYHPSQEYIIFATNKLGFANFELFIVDTEGKKVPQRVTTTDGFDGLPVFSPQGDRLLWTSTRTSDEQSQLFLSQWDHEEALALLANAPNRETSRDLTTGQTSPAAAMSSTDVSNGTLQALQAPEAGTPNILEEELREKVEYLANDALQGRMTGSQGLEQAANQTIEWFQSLGLEPLSTLDQQYRHEFDFVRSIEIDSDGLNTLETTFNGRNLTYPLGESYMPFAFSANGSGMANVVFAGYGVKSPDDFDTPINDYGTVDVEGKFVVVFRGLPPHLTRDQERELSRFATPRFKSVQAAREGALGVLFVDNQAHGGSYDDLGQEFSTQQAGILASRIQPAVAEAWFNRAELGSLEEVKAEYETYNPHASASADLGFEISMNVALEKVEETDANIIAQIPAQNTDKTILLGAHLDHLGFGEVGSLATGPERTTIHNGADDNASGTAMVIELAEYFANLEAENPGTLQANLVFALWSGEELGLIGSSAFVESDAIDMEQVSGYLNFDMVGMLDDNSLILQGLGSSPDWTPMIERKNVLAGFDLVLQEDPYVPTDGMAVYQADVPILCFFTGIHDHYHRPSDDAENLNYAGMTRITDMAKAMVLEMHDAEPLTFQSVEMTESQMGASRGFSVTLGTIPDYANQEEGVKLSGVREGAPAEAAGLQADDVIVELAGKEINDLYDYTYILGDLEAGEEVSIVVIRAGERLSLTITPAAR
jgi:Tol biopolymer transport system component